MIAMRYIVLLVASLAAYATADILKVKCGDEKCESELNSSIPSGVTTF